MKKFLDTLGKYATQWDNFLDQLDVDYPVFSAILTAIGFLTFCFIILKAFRII